MNKIDVFEKLYIDVQLFWKSLRIGELLKHPRPDLLPCKDVPVYMSRPTDSLQTFATINCLLPFVVIDVRCDESQTYVIDILSVRGVVSIAPRY